MIPKVVLWSAETCPFAHRARIALRQKNIPYETKEVDLYDKKEEFTAVYKKALFHDPSSTGKVPTIQIDDLVITESEPILWYLAETFKEGTELIPETPLERAKLRYFASEIGSKVIGTFYSFIPYFKTPEKQQEIVENAGKVFEKFDEHIVGPFILGEKFSLADVLFWPWFDRWVAIDHYIKPNIQFSNYKKISTWIDALKKRDSISSTSGLTEVYLQGTKKFFQKPE